LGEAQKAGRERLGALIEDSTVGSGRSGWLARAFGTPQRRARSIRCLSDVSNGRDTSNDVTATSQE
jgi:hypothetical protein